MANRLINETSPYLLQHAENPVDWYPYGPEALEQAKKRDCPIIISIGYSACHWCHVMEHESFSVPDIAEIMNKNFVCIKVDREERPDIDQIYLNAVQLLHGQGGWPLNAFALPDGRPFWGGTYFRPDQWKDVLQQLSDMYKQNYEELLTQAERIHSGIKSMSVFDAPRELKPLNNNVIQDAFDQLAHKFDKDLGGTIGGIKFPMPSIWEFVLNYHYISQSGKALDQLKLTLDKMMRGGIFDQLGGGFARYSTDREWKVPHFEKMLYDNAQLAALYANSYLVTGDQNYLATVSKIFDFIDKELTSDEGGFFSALDADSEGIEGLYYVWKKQELIDLLPEYSELLSRYWGIEKQGYWEDGVNVLVRPYTDDQFAQIEHLSAEELRQLVNMASKVLLNERNKRTKPSLDDKIIASWNALMIKGYAVAAIATHNNRWEESALKAADFLTNNMIGENGKILRTWKNGVAKINGFLDDYAFAAEAFIYLYNLTFDEAWLLKARELTDRVLRDFSQSDSPMFWYMAEDSDDKNVLKLSRILETTDGVEPSGNSVMAWVLLALGQYFENNDYISRSEQMCIYIQKNLIAYPNFHGYWGSVTASHVQGISLVAITGRSAVEYARRLHNTYHPNTLLAAAVSQSELPVFYNKFKDNKTLIYKCINHTCEAPVERLEDLNI